MARVVLTEDLRRQGYITLNVAADTLGTTKATLNRYIWDRGISVKSFTPRETSYEIVRLSDLSGFNTWRQNGRGQRQDQIQITGPTETGPVERAHMEEENGTLVESAGGPEIVEPGYGADTREAGDVETDTEENNPTNIRGRKITLREFNSVTGRSLSPSYLTSHKIRTADLTVGHLVDYLPTMRSVPPEDREAIQRRLREFLGVEDLGELLGKTADRAIKKEAEYSGNAEGEIEDIETAEDDYLLLDDFAEQTGVPADDVETLWKYEQLRPGKGLKGEERDGKIYIVRKGSREIVERYKTDAPWFDVILDYMDEHEEEKVFSEKGDAGDGGVLEESDSESGEGKPDVEIEEEVEDLVPEKGEVVVDEESGEIQRSAEREHVEEETKEGDAAIIEPVKKPPSRTITAGFNYARSAKVGPPSADKKLTEEEVELIGEMDFTEFVKWYKDLKKPFEVWATLRSRTKMIRRYREEMF